MTRPFNKALPGGGYREVEPKKDQPCNVVRCRYNRGGGCVKIFYAGALPPGAGTDKCPGKILVPKDPMLLKDVHLEHLQRSPTKIIKGQQTGFFQSIAKEVKPKVKQ